MRFAFVPKLVMRKIWFELRKRYYLHLLRRKKSPAAILDHLRSWNHLDLKRPIRETDFVVLDTETTGLYFHKGDRIVSISALRIKDGRIDLSDTFHELVNPNRDIPGKAVVVHEILPRMVDGKPTLEKILPNFVEYVGHAVLVGHHAWLDMGFLNREMTRLCGFSLRNMVLDTVSLDQALIVMKTPISMRNKIKLDSSLGALAERYHVSLDQRHSSFGDALVTAQIFQHMIKQAEKFGILTLKGLLRIALNPPALIGVGEPEVSPM